MKDFSLRTLEQLKKGQLLLFAATLANTSKDRDLVSQEALEIEDTIASIEFQIDVKKREIEIQD